MSCCSQRPAAPCWVMVKGGRNELGHIHAGGKPKTSLSVIRANCSSSSSFLWCLAVPSDTPNDEGTKERRGFPFGPSSAKEETCFQHVLKGRSGGFSLSPFPGCRPLPWACPAWGWELRQREGKEKALPDTPPFGFRETPFPPQPWEMLVLPLSLLLPAPYLAFHHGAGDH